LFSGELEEENQVRLTAGILALCGAALLCLAGFPGLSVIAGGSSVRFSILFDLGDGTYVWADETVADAQTTNATWNAVQHAASSNGIALSSGWTQFGVGIFDMGDRLDTRRRLRQGFSDDFGRPVRPERGDGRSRVEQLERPGLLIARRLQRFVICRDLEGHRHPIRRDGWPCDLGHEAPREPRV